MALQITPNQFILPGNEGVVQAFEKVGDNLERRAYRQEQLENQKQVRKQASANFLQNYLDPKDYYTGTNYDPVIVGQLNDAMQQGADLASKGADTPTIMMALSPMVRRISDYSTKAKAINQQIDEDVKLYQNQPGYDAAKLRETARGLAFQNYDPQTGSFGGSKDITTLDPSKRYVGEAIDQYSEMFSNESGLQTAIEKAPTQTFQPRDTNKIAGIKYDTGYDAKLPYYMQFKKEKDDLGNPAGVEVQYDHMQDGGKEFKDDNGNPIKIAPEEVYRDFINRPGVKPDLDAKTKQYFRSTNQEIPKKNSSHWEQAQRMILYDDLSRMSKYEYSPIRKRVPDALSTRIELGYPPTQGGGSKNAATTEIQDVYSEVDKLASDKLAIGKSLPFNELSASAQSTLLKYARDLMGKSAEHLNQKNIFIEKMEDGTIYIKDNRTKKVITALSAKDVNLKANTTAKQKQEILKQDKNKQNRPSLDSFIKK